MHIYLTLGILLCAFYGVDCKDELIAPNASVILHFGTTVTVPCRVPSFTNVDCAWRKDKQSVVVGKGTHKEYYDWPERKSGDCSILLKNINPKHHDGTWQCQVTDVGHMDKSVRSKPFRIITASLPEDPKIDISSEGIVSKDEIFTTHTRITIRNKSVLKLQCTSCCGLPKQKLVWKSGPKSAKKNYKPDMREGHSENQLENSTWSIENTVTINVQATDDHLQLGCAVVWGKRPLKSSWVALNVLHQPESIEMPVNVTGRKYQMNALRCPLTGNPTPTYTWFRKTDDAFSPVASGVARQNLLFLFFTQYVDAGIYKCVATNIIDGKEGTGEALLNFMVTDKPIEQKKDKGKNTRPK